MADNDHSSTATDLTPTGDTLAEHAKAIRALGRQTVANIIEIGRRLTEAKAIAGHGGWLPWLEREFAWKERNARNFMTVYEMSKSAKFADLDIPISGLYLLAAPSTPEAARAEILDRAEQGEKITVAAVQLAVAATKTPEPIRAKIIEAPPSRAQPPSAPPERQAETKPRSEPTDDPYEELLALYDELKAEYDALKAASVRLQADRDEIAAAYSKLKAAYDEREEEVATLQREHAALQEEVAALRLVAPSAASEPAEGPPTAADRLPGRRKEDGRRALEMGFDLLDSGLSTREHAAKANISQGHAARTRTAAEVLRACPDIGVDDVADRWRGLCHIHAAPRELWPALVSKMIANQWTIEATHEEVQRVMGTADPAGASPAEIQARLLN
jgi:DUF3102 family protein